MYTHTHTKEICQICSTGQLGEGERVPSYYLDDWAHPNSMC